jgi:hypothetical protein
LQRRSNLKLVIQMRRWGSSTYQSLKAYEMTFAPEL